MEKIMRRDDNEHIRLEFGRRLQKKLDERGWTQSELGRRMAALLPNSRVGRDNISKYIRGRVLPLPHHLAAICKVLECEPSDLLPSRAHRNGKDQSDLFLEDFDDGTTRIRLDRVVPSKMALKVYALLNEAT
jgi:transcriptional regulator with XRE-family HTH domain